MRIVDGIDKSVFFGTSWEGKATSRTALKREGATHRSNLLTPQKLTVRYLVLPDAKFSLLISLRRFVLASTPFYVLKKTKCCGTPEFKKIRE